MSGRFWESFSALSASCGPSGFQLNRHIADLRGPLTDLRLREAGPNRRGMITIDCALQPSTLAGHLVSIYAIARAEFCDCLG